ncbi:MAG TPA: HD domain-containing protein [Geobacteraceae bacterium]|nr:HD domain-containing protein [Geobacteraceae bacterium]
MREPPGVPERLIPLVEELRAEFPETSWPSIWLTGGTVRDAFLGREGNDLDLAAAVQPELLARRGFRPVQGRSTAPIWFRYTSDRGKVEITLLAEGVGIVADLQRRDFTMNAVAVDLAGEVTDPLAGRQDLERGEIVPCSGKTFIDDPLRVFRAFRFAAEGFHLSGGVRELLDREEWDRLLERIPVERFSRELLRALASPRPDLFFRLMLRYRSGRLILPELFAMPRVPAGPQEYHPEGDLFRHSCQVLTAVAASTADPLARYCAFLHDIGKLASDPALHPRHHGHEEAGFAAASELGRRLQLPREYGRALAWVCRLHGKANRLETLRPGTAIGLAEQALKGGVDGILPLVSAADSPGGMDQALWRKLLDVARMTVRQLGIDQESLLRVPEEKRGEVILQRRVEVLRKPG